MIKNNIIRHVFVVLFSFALSCAPGNEATQMPTSTDPDTPQDATSNPGDSSSAISFKIDPGYRINFGSNPRIMDYQDGQLTLGYEYQAEELADTPGERGYVALANDGLSFSGNRPFQPGESKGKGVLIDGTLWRRYYEDQSLGKLLSESSTDGINYVRPVKKIRDNISGSLSVRPLNPVPCERTRGASCRGRTRAPLRSPRARLWR